MVSTGLIIDQIITGLSIGSTLFLIAVGLSLIFGVLGVLNFAHGVLYMIGAYMAIVAINQSLGGFWVGLVLSALVVGGVGIVLEVVFLRRVYERDVLDQLLLTFAFVLIITDIIRFLFGTGSRVVSAPALLRFDLVLSESASIPGYRAFVILVSIIVMGVILLALRSTNFGRLVRATSSDRDMALLLGIDVPKLYTAVFFIGAVLAGLGGAFAAPLQSITPSLGNKVIINAFVIVVIGGLGSFTGAFIGAYLVGLMIAVGSIYVAGAGQLLPFLVVIGVLLLKPEGLVGGVEA